MDFCHKIGRNSRLLVWRMRKLIVMVLMLAFWPETSGAGDLSQFYRDNYLMPSAELYAKAERYGLDSDLADSALVCYTILSNRFSPDLPMDEKVLCIKSIAQMAFLYYFHYYEYSKALEQIARAMEMMEAIETEIPIVYLYYGLMYCSIGQQTRDEPTTMMSIDYLKKAFHTAIPLNDMHTVNIAFSNLISQCYEWKLMHNIEEEWEVYSTLNLSSRESDKNYTLFVENIYHGLLYLQQKQHAEAMQCFDLLLQALPYETLYSRYHCGTWEFKGLVYESMGQIDKCIEAYQHALKIAEEFNILDAKIDIFRLLMSHSDQIHNKEQKYHYQDLYLALKDSLLNYRQVANIDGARFLSKIRKIEAEKMRDQAKRKQLEQVLSICAVFLGLTMLFLIILYLKNRQLRATNLSLYAKNHELFRAEAEERKLRAERAIVRVPEPELVEASPTEATLTEAMPTEERYRSSNLSEEDKDQILDRITDAMNNMQEVCQADFTVDRLAELADARTKQVSQVINERYGCNFNTFVNNYRIREACRQLDNPEQRATFTIEALSLSLGFKSRSTFVIQFKRVTGMTPSQYQKMSISSQA